jgi:hypothetical protein
MNMCFRLISIYEILIVRSIVEEFQERCPFEQLLLQDPVEVVSKIPHHQI